LVSRRIPLIVLSIGAITAASSFIGCPRSNTYDLEKGGRMPTKTIEQVLNERTNEWMAIPGVVGVAIGEFKGKPCIRVFTSINPQKLQAKIPSTVEGYPVIIEETGSVRALEQKE
jgi:hypothetical protein